MKDKTEDNLVALTGFDAGYYKLMSGNKIEVCTYSLNEYDEPCEYETVKVDVPGECIA